MDNKQQLNMTQESQDQKPQEPLATPSPVQHPTILPPPFNTVLDMASSPHVVSPRAIHPLSVRAGTIGNIRSFGLRSFGAPQPTIGGATHQASAPRGVKRPRHNPPPAIYVPPPQVTLPSLWPAACMHRVLHQTPHSGNCLVVATTACTECYRRGLLCVVLVTSDAGQPTHQCKWCYHGGIGSWKCNVKYAPFADDKPTIGLNFSIPFQVLNAGSLLQQFSYAVAAPPVADVGQLGTPALAPVRNEHDIIREGFTAQAAFLNGVIDFHKNEARAGGDAVAAAEGRVKKAEDAMRKFKEAEEAYMAFWT